MCPGEHVPGNVLRECAQPSACDPLHLSYYMYLKRWRELCRRNIMPIGRPSAMQRRTVILASVTAFMVGLDVLVIMTALPTLLQTLRANATDLGWTVSAYEIGFAASILTSSALGDRYGRRLVFVAGVAVFTLGSAWCALSSAFGIGMLIMARAFEGIGGGTAMA